jgi:tRNA U54 and U55 pseudouridine synthase Pus10
VAYTSLKQKLKLKDSITSRLQPDILVLSIVDEHKPKCYLCQEIFENVEELRKHQEAAHKDFIEYHRKKQNYSPAPGDVTLF